MGRNPIRANLKRKNRVTVLFTDNELAALEKAVDDRNQESLSAMIRDTVLVHCPFDYDAERAELDASEAELCDG